MGRRVVERHDSWTKRNLRQKFMKALIPISPKKNWAFNGSKMDYPEITTSRKTQPKQYGEPNIHNLNLNNNIF